MKILITDKLAAAAVNFLKNQNIDFSYQPEITPEELLKRIPNFDALIVRSRTHVTKDVIVRGEKLKVIGRPGTGVDNVDLTACRTKKIVVVNSPGANSNAVAEHTLGLMLSLLRQYEKVFFSMKNGLWLKKKLTGKELSGKIVGIVGYGHIGKKVARLVHAFGAKVLFYSRSSKNCSLAKLFKISDIATLHLALTSQTKKMINNKLLSVMKPTAYLINTSRGEIIDEQALYHVLVDKKIAGAALDVFWEEPLPADSKWRKLDNVILTPHIGASTKEALERASITVMEDVIRVLKGKNPKNRVI